MWTERLRPLILERKATFFEATHRDRLRRLRRARRRDRGGRGGARRAARQHQRGPAAGQRGHQDRARSHEVPGRHAGADRLREGGHRQARGAVRRSASATRRWWTCSGGRRGTAVGGRPADGRADVRVLPPAYEWTGPLGLAGPHQRRNAGVAHGDPDGAARALSARPPRRSSAASAGRSIAGRLDRRGKWLFDVAHNPDGMRALVRGHRGHPAAAAAPRAGLDPGRQGVARDAGASSTG